MATTVSLAVIGSGLAGSLLAQELASVADVTVFERGPTAPVKPPRPLIEHHQLGLFPSFAYGLGGTAGFCDGGLIAMSLPEYASHWPLGIAAELDGYLERVVSLLYGAQTGGWWAARQKVRIASDLFLDEIIEPSIPFRANLSDFFRGVRMKINHEVIAVSEAHEKIRVTTKSINGTDEYEFDLVVVAAGGFNSPLLIKKSKIGGEMVGLNITDHPMGFVAKIASGNSPNKFGDLLARSLDLHPYEPMLKVCDQKSGLWTAFYLRPTLDAIIRSDPMVGLHPVRLTPA